MNTIASMTLDELRAFVLALIQEQRRDEADTLGDMSELFGDDAADTRTLEDVFASIEARRWTPPAGALSPTELLRSDRDR